MREHGYALRDSYFGSGLRILAVPVLDIDGYPVAALSVAAPIGAHDRPRIHAARARAGAPRRHRYRARHPGERHDFGHRLTSARPQTRNRRTQTEETMRVNRIAGLVAVAASLASAGVRHGERYVADRRHAGRLGLVRGSAAIAQVLKPGSGRRRRSHRPRRRRRQPDGGGSRARPRSRCRNVATSVWAAQRRGTLSRQQGDRTSAR